MKYGRYLWHLRRIARTFPGYWAAAVGVVVLAWCSTVYPLGVPSRVQSPGLVGGLWLGLAAGLIGSVPAAAGLAIAGIGGDADTGLAEVQSALGVPVGRRSLGWILVAVSLIVDWAVMGMAAGALVGIGRGLATSGRLIGSGHIVGLASALLAVGAAAYAAVLGAGTAARFRGRTEAAIALAGGALAFFGLLGVLTPGTPARWLLRLTPFGPVWSAALPPGHSALVLSMGSTARVLVVAGWIALAGVALVRGARFARPQPRVRLTSRRRAT